MNMTKPMKTLFSTAAVCIVIAFTSVASANASENDITFDSPRDHKGNKHKMKRMAKALSLSEEQKVEIKAIKTQAKEQHQTLQASMKEFKIAEQELLQSEVFDEQAYTALQASNQSTFAQLALIRAKAKHAFFNVLTTAQQEKWLKMKEHHKGKGKGKGKGNK